MPIMVCYDEYTEAATFRDDTSNASGQPLLIVEQGWTVL